MASISNGIEFGAAVCGVLGLDPALVTKITIDIEQDTIIQAHCSIILTDQDAGRIASLLKRYEIKPK